MQTLKTLWKERKYLFVLSWRFLKEKYIGSVLGIAWAFITPLILAGVISLIFGKVAKINLPRYPLFVLSGLLPWMYFSQTIQESCYILLSSTTLLKQFTFSPVLIPFSRSGANFLNFLFGFTVILPAFLFFEPSFICLFFLPLFLFLFFLFTTGWCLFLCWLHVFFRDTGHLISLVLLFWFWLTPIFYTLSFVPLPYRNWLLFNPMTSFVIIFQKLLYEGKFPSFGWLGLAILNMIIFFGLGVITFERKINEAIKRL